MNGGLSKQMNCQQIIANNRILQRTSKYLPYFQHMYLLLVLGLRMKKGKNMSLP